MDPLLRKALGASDTPVTPACLDAERLAAWSEGALSAADVAAIESHLSTCGRCQGMAAVFSRIEPAAPATVPFWRRPSLAWLIPLGAVAAVALFWTARPRVPDLPSQTQTARVETPTEPVPLPPVGPPGTAGASERKSSVTPPPPPPPPPPPQRRSAPTTAAATQPAPVTPPTALVEQPAAAPKPMAVAPPPAAATAPPPATTPPVQATTATADARAAGAGLRSRDIVGEVTVSESTAGVAEIIAPAITTAQPAVVGGAAGRGARAGGGGGGGGRGGSVTAQAVSPPVRWRILPTRVVERSTDAGASWTPLSIDPPVALTGGVAASNTICWLIGPTGVVLRSVDGIHFDRVAFPEPVNLVSIRSTGAAQASVTTADGRVFFTIDGGLTWRLQGFPASSF